MDQIIQPKRYDLEDRTFNFAERVRFFIAHIPTSIIIKQDGPQLIRSSGSIGANYIEANESLSKKDFVMRVKICRKEAKETIYWLRLIKNNTNELLEKERLTLITEATELMKIFGSIVSKST